MSISLYWQPVDGTPLAGQSTVKGALENAFGRLPVELDETHVPVLRGMAATWQHQDNPYDDLIDAIDKHGRVRVWHSY